MFKIYFIKPNRRWNHELDFLKDHKVGMELEVLYFCVDYFFLHFQAFLKAPPNF